ncbi:MAG: MalY/PatB family protein [Anaerorhabdus sp.]
MKFNFEEVVDRNDTGCLKYDGRGIFSKGKDQIPLWIADMDLLSPPCVNEAFKKRMEHSLYGYNYASDSYYESIVLWMKNQHDYIVEKEEICPFPGVVPALALLYRAYLSDGECIMVQEPGYGPFRSIADQANYRVINTPLINNNGYYTMDYVKIEENIKKENVKIFTLCNPHNPVGRVWTKDELSKLASICIKYNVIIISDEIHADLVFKPNKHIPLPLISNDIAEACVVCTAPTKAFNLAGMKVSNIIIKNKELREKFKEECERYDLVSLHTFSYVACESVYREGKEWLEQLLDHISSNYDLLEEFLRAYPNVRFKRAEATYLAWFDVSDLGYSLEELKKRFEDNKLWVEFQDDFNDQSGRLFFRMNIAISKTKLKEVLKHLSGVFKKEKK